MKTTSWNTILAGIGAILVLALVNIPIHNADAQVDSTNVLYKLQDIQNKITSLKENTKDFDTNEFGKQEFNFRTVGNALLEIQESNFVTNEGKITIVVDYLMTDYKETFKDYKNQLNEYQKNNVVSMKQRQLFNNMIQNYGDFNTADVKYQEKTTQKEFVQSELKKIEREEKFQDFINKVSITIVGNNGGNKVQKIYHERALENIVKDENWELVTPALNRVINQFSNPEIKSHLIMYKEKALDLIEKLEKAKQKQPEILTLTHDETILNLVGNLNPPNEILTPSIISAQLKNEIKSIIQDSKEIIDEENSRIEGIVESQRIDSQEEDGKSTKSLSNSESEIKVKKNGNGDGNFKGQGNSNGNGDEIGKGKGVN